MTVGAAKRWGELDFAGCRPAPRPARARLPDPAFEEPPSDEALWGRFHTATVEELEPRIEALVELAEREHPDLPSFVRDELEREGLKPRWRDALVIITERVLFPDPADRRRVAASLRRHALALRDVREPESDEALWACVWRYTTLILPAEIGTLLDFLRPVDTITTHQVALQSIENMFSRRLPDPALPLGDLRLRVEALAEESLAAPELDSAEKRAHAISAYCAVAALASPRLGVLTDRLRALNRSSMIFGVLQRLRPVAQAWSATVGPGDPEPTALASLRAALGRLETALSELESPRGEE